MAQPPLHQDKSGKEGGSNMESILYALAIGSFICAGVSAVASAVIYKKLGVHDAINFLRNKKVGSTSRSMSKKKPGKGAAAGGSGAAVHVPRTTNPTQDVVKSGGAAGAGAGSNGAGSKGAGSGGIGDAGGAGAVGGADDAHDSADLPTDIIEGNKNESDTNKLFQKGTPVGEVIAPAEERAGSTDVKGAGAGSSVSDAEGAAGGEAAAAATASDVQASAGVAETSAGATGVGAEGAAASGLFAETEKPTSILREDDAERPTSLLSEDDAERPTSLLQQDEAERPTSLLSGEETERPTSLLAEDSDAERPTSVLTESDSERPTSVLSKNEIVTGNVLDEESEVKFRFNITHSEISVNTQERI